MPTILDTNLTREILEYLDRPSLWGLLFNNNLQMEAWNNCTTTDHQFNMQAVIAEDLREFIYKNFVLDTDGHLHRLTKKKRKLVPVGWFNFNDKDSWKRDHNYKPNGGNDSNANV